MHILVTGGAGFIGSHIVKESLQLDYVTKVSVIDNLVTGTMENFPFNDKRVYFIKDDMRDPDRVVSLTQDVDTIFHFAALPSVQQSFLDPLRSHVSNVIPTINILEASRINNISRVVFASSSAVYGNSNKKFLLEDDPLKPISPYGIEKVMCESYMRIYYDEYSVKTHSMRFFNVFGPNQNLHSQYTGVIPQFVQQALNNESLTIFGDGLNTRDFTYVEDVAKATTDMINVEKYFGQAINYAYGEPISIVDLATKIIELTNSESPVNFDTPRSGDIKFSAADITKYSSLQRHKRSFNLEEGLKNLIRWFKNQ